MPPKKTSSNYMVPKFLSGKIQWNNHYIANQLYKDINTLLSSSATTKVFQAISGKNLTESLEIIEKEGFSGELGLFVLQVSHLALRLKE